MTGNAPVPPAAWFIFLTIDRHILTYAECVMMDPSRQVKRYEPGRAAKYSFRYAAVAAMSIVNRICMFVFSVGLGIGQGFQPVSAFNYGAKKYERVRKGFYFTLTAGEVLLGAIAVAGMFFPAQLVAVFQKDPEVVAIGGIARRAQLVALFFQPMTVCANMMFQSIWKNGRATLLAMLRNLMYYSEKRLTVPA